MVDARPVASLLEQVARLVFAEQVLLGLAPGQWAILRYLEKAGRQAGTLVGISSYMDLPEATARLGLQAMARKGLVLISPGSDLVELTLDGKNLLLGDPVERIVVAIKPMPEADLAELSRLLEAVYDNLAKADRPAPAS
jgi:DNA-binding MarR family transcriptional regulator